MVGHFELFTDHLSRIRFQLLAPDGSVLAVSGPFNDRRAAAAAITELRECAGTGLIKDHFRTTTTMVMPKPGLAVELEDLNDEQ